MFLLTTMPKGPVLNQSINIFKQSGTLFYQGRQVFSGSFSKKLSGIKISRQKQLYT